MKKACDWLQFVTFRNIPRSTQSISRSIFVAVWCFCSATLTASHKSIRRNGKWQQPPTASGKYLLVTNMTFMRNGGQQSEFKSVWKSWLDEERGWQIIVSENSRIDCFSWAPLSSKSKERISILFRSSFDGLLLDLMTTTRNSIRFSSTSLNLQGNSSSISLWKFFC